MIKSVIFDMYETLITLHQSPLYFGTQIAIDAGSLELESASEIGMKVVQAVWYLKERTIQPSRRKKNFIQAETPLEILQYI